MCVILTRRHEEPDKEIVLSLEDGRILYWKSYRDAYNFRPSGYAALEAKTVDDMASHLRVSKSSMVLCP